jgi:hypothetical protein
VDIHVQSYKTDIYKKSVINMGTTLCNNMPCYIKGMVFKVESKLFLLYKAFYSVEELVSL